MAIQIKNIEGECFEATNGDFLLRAGSCGDKTKIESSISPGKLFLVSLGMCVGTYLVRFCKRHEIDHQNLIVNLNYEDSEDPPKIEKIEISIDLDVNEKYRPALLRVAEQCYVKQTIQKELELNYNFAVTE